MPASSNPAITVSGSEMFSDLMCKITRSPAVLESHVSLECYGDFLQHSWYNFLQKCPVICAAHHRGTSKTHSKIHE